MKHTKVRKVLSLRDKEVSSRRCKQDFNDVTVLNQEVVLFIACYLSTNQKTKMKLLENIM